MHNMTDHLRLIADNDSVLCALKNHAILQSS